MTSRELGRKLLCPRCLVPVPDKLRVSLDGERICKHCAAAAIAVRELEGSQWVWDEAGRCQRL